MTAQNLINLYTSTNWQAAPSRLPELEKAAREVVAGRSYTVTAVLLHAGNATRWQRSLSEHPDLARRDHVSPGDPRGLAQVANLLPGHPGPDRLPVLTYAYYGVHRMACNHITYHSDPADTERFMQAATYAGVTTWLHHVSAAERTKAAPGHAAVLCRILPDLADADIIVTQFGSDPVNPRTVELGALAMAALYLSGSNTGVILPTARHGAYPVSVDEAGLVRGLSHNKLTHLGDTDTTRHAGWSAGGSNVGLRMYSGDALRTILRRAAEHHRQTGSYTPEGGEFSLDHVDAQLAAAGRCRQLFIATDAEARPAKTIDQLPAFEAAQRDIFATIPL